jgi:23S rRNA pseudouridine2605 synthase
MPKKFKKTAETEILEPQSTEPKAKAKAKPRAKTKAKIADPIGDISDGEAQIALESVPGPETKDEIAAAEDNAETNAEAEGAGYTESTPEAETSPEAGTAIGTAAQDAAKSLEPEGGGGFNPRTKKPKSRRALAPEEPISKDVASSIPAGAEPGPEDAGRLPDSSEPEPESSPRPPANLDRLQKILAQAGVASRRKAEEMIEQGRVQVNGKVVTVLGSKADAARDHIRVDGKLLQGAERLRYFVLNKPRGFVTTVKDPEGRPTVMQFFDKMRERLYPVGRLDYMSEGLLLVTNDGELAHRLTRASAGVEKTYLVKVAGIPTEAELDQLRSGVSIERGSPGPPRTGLRPRGGGKPGSDKVRTSPARIRQVRQGDNPWYEVVLIEGRNRELRKMFEEIGHFVEKIRRVGYGPLVLDQEPGNLRELDPQELALLRQAADGTLRTPKSKDVRRRNLIDAGQLPTVSPRFSSPRPSSRPAKPFAAKSFDERPAAGPKDYRPKKSFDTARPARPGGPARQAGPARPAGKDFRPSRSSDAPRFSSPARFSGGPGYGQGYRPADRPSARPAWQRDDRQSRPPARFTPDSAGNARPQSGKTFGARPRDAKPYAAKPFGAKSNFSKPAWNKPGPQSRPPFKPSPAPRPQSRVRDEDFGPVRPPNLHIEEIHGTDRPVPARSAPSRPSGPRPGSPRAGAPYTRPGRPSPDRPRPDRPRSDRASQVRSSSGRPSSARPFRSEGGPPRPFTTSSGKPRPGGARPSSKPSGSGYKGKPSGFKRTGKPSGKKRR